MLRHIILTQGRSGSNFLSNTLNLHPAIVNYGEVLGDWTLPSKLLRVMRVVGFSTCDFLELLFRSYTLFYFAQIWSVGAHLRKQKPINFKRRSNIQSIGIKEFGIHFQRFDLEDFLLENPDIAVIHLYRKNLLHRYLSLQSLDRYRIVGIEGKPVSLSKMQIDIEDLLMQLEVLDQEAQYEYSLIEKLRGNPVLHISYEEAFASTATLQATTRQVFEFLGVPPLEQISSQRKILPKSLKETVENYDEIFAALQPTRYAQYLD